MALPALASLLAVVGGAPLPAAGGPPLTAADVAPLFAAGALGKASAALAEGRGEEAALGFASSPRPEARVIEATALLAAGRATDASARLAGLEAQLPDIADRIGFLRAQADERAGRAAEAAEGYGRVPAGSLLRPEAVLARSRLLDRLGEPQAALDALGSLLAAPAPEDVSRPDAAAEALLAAARLRLKGPAPDPAGARADLLQCWAGHPLAPAAPRCLEALRALPGPAGESPPPADALRRAEALLEANRNRAALGELQALLERGPLVAADRCRARLALGRGYRKERRYRQAIEALGSALAACPEAPGRARALHALAAAAAVVAPDEAVDHYRRLAREHADNPIADDALVFAADLLARAGRTAEARAALSEVVERYPRGDQRGEALFRLAWLSWRADDTAAALATLERAQREYEESDPYEAGRAAYWRGRLLSSGGGPEGVAAAARIWGALVERHPADYYGLLARERLAEGQGRPAAWRRGEREGEGFRYQPGPLRGDPHFRAAVLLLRMGLERPAAEELRSLDRLLVAPAEPHGFDPLLLTAELLHRAGDHRSAHQLVRTLGRLALRQRPEGEALRVWRIAYPAAFRDEVVRWAPATGVPPDLLQALMREESALDPHAVSAAGAVGLTQLMLPTAQAAARKIRLGRKVATADLMDGPLNIRLGAVHLGEVLRRFGGSAPLAVAAYNVGERPVRGWLQERGALPLDEFVEEIPVQETRGYVKRVLRSYAAYRFLYGAPGELPVALGQRLPGGR